MYRSEQPISSRSQRRCMSLTNCPSELVERPRTTATYGTAISGWRLLSETPTSGIRKTLRACCTTCWTLFPATNLSLHSAIYLNRLRSRPIWSSGLAIPIPRASRRSFSSQEGSIPWAEPCKSFLPGGAIAMVSHKPAGHVAGLQKSLVKELVKRASVSGNAPLPVSVWCNKKGLVEKDHTQRTRSFLYVTLGAVVARIFGLDAVDFFENGVVSINLPLAEHELGARATRTTHPQTLAWYSQLLSAVFEQKFQVRNEFLTKTKQDVVEIIKHAGQGELIASSVSCMHTRETTKASPHCGVCSQCVSRRFATLGVDGGVLEPSRLYRQDVLTEPRKRTEDRTIAERFLGFAREISALEDSADFAQRYAAELGRVTRFMPFASSVVIDSVFDLHRRHAEQVNAVIIEAMQASAEDQYLGKIADGSMLAFGFRTSGGDHKAGLPKAAQPSEADDGSRPSHPLSKNQMLLLTVLSEAKSLMSQADMVEATDAKGHRLTRKTIGGELKELRDLDFVCYPKRGRSGAAITPRGRSYLADMKAH